MPTLGVLVVAVVVILLYLIIRNTLKRARIARDADSIDIKVDNNLSAETQAIVEKLKDVKALKYIYKDSIKLTKLPDGQILGPSNMGLELFIEHSDLTHEPSKYEWSFLRNIISKVHDKN